MQFFSPLRIFLIFLFIGNSFGFCQKTFFEAGPGNYWLSTDLHIHTVFSDGKVWPSIRVEEALKEGLDLIAMTEHLEYQPHARDIPHPDRNRSFIIAQSEIQSEERLKVINGSEITREMPTGHINAVFIKDANKLLHKDSLSGIQAANKQGAFVFWNHPNADFQRNDGIARLEPFHNYLIRNGLLHGIEVVNDNTYSEEALQIALENNLTIMGTSDIHGLTDWTHNINNGGHRPMTFVKVENKSISALKKALFNGKTVVWYKDLLIGKETQLKEIIKHNIIFSKPKYKEGKTIMEVQVFNMSATAFKFEYIGEYSFHKHATTLTIPAKGELTLLIKTKVKKMTLELPFRVLNAITSPKKVLELSFLVK